MDDPWAAPSWSTPAKPSSSSPHLQSRLDANTGADGSPRLNKPFGSGGFDDADPWGAPAAGPTHASPRPSPPLHAPSSRSDLDTPGWGSGQEGWRGGGGSFQSQSPERPSAPPTWSPPAFVPADSPSSPARSLSPAPSTPPADTHAPTPPRFPSPPPLDLPITSPPSRRATPAAGADDGPDDDPEAAFAAALPRNAADEMPRFDVALARSPDFGEFGGFSEHGLGAGGVGGGTGWGGDGGDSSLRNNDDAGWGGGEEGQGGFGSDENSHDPDHGAWAGGVDRGGDEEEWEAAQRRLRIQDTLAPFDEINRLKLAWRDVATAAYERRKLPGSALVDDADGYAGTVLKLEGDTRDTLRSLASIPTDINTYPPILSSFQTYTAYQTTLARPNPLPSTSIMTTTFSARRPRQDASLGAGAGAGAGAAVPTPWLARSRLGEPEAPQAEQHKDDDADKRSKWSFWGRKPEPKQLVTSGGGVLEVKPITPTSSATARPSLSTSDRQPSSASIKPSRTASPAPTSLFDEPVDVTGAGFPSPGVASPIGSAPLTPANPSALPLASTATAPAPPPAQQPSAVSRFFGRLSRRPSSQAPTSEADADTDAKDLELGDDDFSFLSDVPSLAPRDKTQGDLLGLGTSRTEQIASLESMIASKPVALPPALAPPPPGRAQTLPPAHAQRGGGTPVQRGDMDLLSDLFDGTAMSASGGGGNGPKAVEVNGWDDFMAPTQLASPIAAPPMRSATSVAASGSTTPSLSLPFVSPPPPTVPTKSPGKPTAAPSAFDDFDDFGTPQASSATTMPSAGDGFDDFGDFADFAPAPTQATPTRPAYTSPTDLSSSSSAPRPLSQFSALASTPKAQAHPAATARTPAFRAPPSAFQTPAPASSGSHAPRRSLDHTPTLNLLDNVNATRGQRWPAPPSPDVPMLVPPPKSLALGGAGGSSLGAFPFLSPPPPGRPASALSMGKGGKSVDFFGDEMGVGASASAGASEVVTSPVAPAPAPAVGAPGAMSGALRPSAGDGKKVLTAQDLSFFDNL